MSSVSVLKNWKEHNSINPKLHRKKQDQER